MLRRVLRTEALLVAKVPQSGLRAKAEAILLVAKATKSKMRSAVDGEQPSKPRPALRSLIICTPSHCSSPMGEVRWGKICSGYAPHTGGITHYRSNKFRLVVVSQTMIAHFVKVG